MSKTKELTSPTSKASAKSTGRGAARRAPATPARAAKAAGKVTVKAAGKAAGNPGKSRSASAGSAQAKPAPTTSGKTPARRAAAVAGKRLGHQNAAKAGGAKAAKTAGAKAAKTGAAKAANAGGAKAGGKVQPAARTAVNKGRNTASARGQSRTEGVSESQSRGKANASPPVRTRTVRHYLQVVLPDGYVPSDAEPFMSEQHKAYFHGKLIAWKEDLIRQTRETLQGLTAASEQHADVADRATSETDRALELRARDRQRKLVAKINAALVRIEDGSYGYCEETGEPIGLRRLEARPIATLSLEAQERHERRERVFRED